MKTERNWHVVNHFDMVLPPLKKSVVINNLLVWSGTGLFFLVLAMTSQQVVFWPVTHIFDLVIEKNPYAKEICIL